VSPEYTYMLCFGVTTVFWKQFHLSQLPTNIVTKGQKIQLRKSKKRYSGTATHRRCNAGKSGKSASLTSLPFCLFAFVKIDTFVKD